MPDENKEDNKKEENKQEPDSIVVPILKPRIDYDIPDDMKLWNKPSDLTPEYKEMMRVFDILIDYIVVSLNEGPEVKDSVAKRISTIEGVLKTIILKSFISVTDRVAILEKCKFDILYNYKMQVMAAQMAAQMLKEQKKADEYVQ